MTFRRFESRFSGQYLKNASVPISEVPLYSTEYQVDLGGKPMHVLVVCHFCGTHKQGYVADVTDISIIQFMTLRLFVT